MPNENCLAGYKCPKCKADGPFDLPTVGVATWTDDGTEGLREPEVDDREGTYGHCLSCKEWSEIDEFKAAGEESDGDDNVVD